MKSLSYSHIHKAKAVSKIELLAGVTVLSIAVGFILPTISHSRTQESRAACLSNLNRIGEAMQGYLNDYQQSWPYVAKLRSFKLHDPPWPTLPDVLKPYIGDQIELFHCPADRRELEEDDPLLQSFSRLTTYYQTEGISYEWFWGEARGGHQVGHETLSLAKGFGFGRADQLLLSDFEPFHKGDGGGAFNTLFADLKGRTTRIREID